MPGCMMLDEAREDSGKYNSDGLGVGSAGEKSTALARTVKKRPQRYTLRPLLSA